MWGGFCPHTRWSMHKNHLTNNDHIECNNTTIFKIVLIDSLKVNTLLICEDDRKTPNSDPTTISKILCFANIFATSFPQSWSRTDQEKGSLCSWFPSSLLLTIERSLPVSAEENLFYSFFFATTQPNKSKLLTIQIYLLSTLFLRLMPSTPACTLTTFLIISFSNAGGSCFTPAIPSRYPSRLVSVLLWILSTILIFLVNAWWCWQTGN